VPETESGGRPFQADDVYRVRTVSDPRVSPDGRSVAYVVTSADREADVYRSHIWLASLDGGELRQLTRGDHKNSSPRWSPDGRTLAFVSDRKERNQIWLIGESGEAWQLTETAKGATSPAWSPDGETLLFLTRTRTEGETKPNDKRTPVEKNAPRVLRDLVYRFDGEGQFDGALSHVWTVPVAGGEARQVTSGDWVDVDPSWSRDGREIVLGSYREADRGERRIKDVWVVSAHPGEGRRLTEGRGPSLMPSLSPDGRRIAYAGHVRGAEFGSATALVWSVPLGGGEPRPLTEALDRSVLGVPAGMALAWLPDGSDVLFLGMDAAASRLYRVPASGGESVPITGTDRYVTAFSPVPTGERVVYSALSPANPGELFVVPVSGGEARQLTHHNDELRAEIAFAAPESVSFTGAAGWEISALLVKPHGYRQGTRYPLALDVHGGPHGMHGHSFQPGVQEMAARGYAVLMVNPRGSTGYGEPFTAACVGDWGGKDYEDLLLGVDWAIAQGIADPDRLLVTGYSYGGFMTSWVVGHTDRFRAAVCGAPVSDIVSFYGESDIGSSFGAFEHDGQLWERWDAYRERSPLYYIHNCHTPFLLLHWEGDLRCPIGQSEELFAVLKRLGREVEFVRYPGGFHTYVTHAPSQRVDAFRRTVDWFDQGLQRQRSESAPTEREPLQAARSGAD